MRIGIDLMGSDRSPEVIFKAVLKVAERVGNVHTFVLISTPHVQSSIDHTHPIEWVLAEEEIEMNEAPLLAFRRKKNSSMHVGIGMIKEKRLDAFVSTGNTGALMATATFLLPRLVERPALMVTMPNGERGVSVLDVGANLTPKPHHIVSFAHMGIIYREIMHEIEHPTCGLLNVGAEEQKGPKELKETYHLMQEEFGSRFKGNVEGREVFLGKVDVLVTDGFTGNVFLKTCEGISSFLFDYLHEKFSNAGGIEKVASHLHEKFNYSKHPGALLCGVDGVVVKCHGHSNRQALVNGILGAIDVAEKGVIPQMRERLIPRAKNKDTKAW
ncbi:MAG: phosphate acyltransferase PlsX [Chlamydiales bacterium]